MFFLDIKLALRNLVRNRIYSLLIIGGFAIGFAACIMIGLFYRTETTVNHGFPNHKEIYRLYDVKKNRCNLNWDLFPVIKNDFASVDDVCPLDYQDRELITIKDIESSRNAQIKCMVATTNNFFSIFSVKIIESTSEKPFENRESVAISRPTAKSLFGEQNPLGRSINVGNYFFGTVTSVFEELPGNSSFSADIILNSENQKFRFSTTNTNGKTYNPTNLFIRVIPRTDPQFLSEELNRSATLRQLDTDSLALQAFDDIYLSELTIKSRHLKGNRVLLNVFLAIASLILILSSINYFNYSVSLQYSKLKETGIKMTFGAAWKDLVRYTLIEVSIGIFISLLLALVITDFTLPFTEKIFGKPLQVNLNDIIALAPYFGLIVFLVIIINSVAPLYILSRLNIAGFLSGTGRQGGAKQIWKQVLLSLQLTVSIILITIGIVIYRQLDYLKHSDPGFDKEVLLRINIPYKFKETDALCQELKKLSFIKDLSLSSGCPGMINHRMDSDYEGKTITVNCIYVGDDYLRTMGIDLMAGRDFMSGDLNRGCLMNEEAFRQYGWGDHAAKRFNNGQEGGFEVIGKIQDFNFESYHNSMEPLALLYTSFDFANVLTVRLAEGNKGQQIEEMEKIWKSVTSDEPFSFVFYDDFYQTFYLKEEQLARSISFFTLIAIALTCMGILGQIFMICLSGVKEIGVRKINGAEIPGIMLLLNKSFLKWYCAAMVVATPFSVFITHKWLSNYAYKTSLSWWIFGLSGLITLLIIIITVSWQSWKAATRNPVEALRYE